MSSLTQWGLIGVHSDMESHAAPNLDIFTGFHSSRPIPRPHYPNRPPITARTEDLSPSGNEARGLRVGVVRGGGEKGSPGNLL